MSVATRNELSGLMGTQSHASDAFQQLVQSLNGHLENSPGSAFEDINHQLIIEAMEGYKSSGSDWSKYALPDAKRCFTRNLVDPGNGKHNLLILVWTPGKESPIHDHAGSHCIMKILQGRLKETQYSLPDGNVDCRGHGSPLHPKKETTLFRDEVTYITDNHGLHKVVNPDPSEYAVSLHLYAPPNAAKDGFQVFDECTGEAKHVVRYDIFSEMGKVNDPQTSCP